MHRDVSILFLLKISPTVFVAEEGGLRDKKNVPTRRILLGP